MMNAAPLYMLDTNTVSHAIKVHPIVAQRVVEVAMASLCVSAVTAGELRYGLAKRPQTGRLEALVIEFLRRVNILPWDRFAAERYGALRAELERAGRPLGALDFLIAAHALTVGAVLVTSDRAFGRVAGLHVEDWTVPPT
jgi:tRNA(fMet)-specific endonuclease VapC